MNKLFTKIATAFVGIAMAIGVGVAVGSHSDVRAAYADSTTVTFADQGWSNSSAHADFTVSNFRFVKSGNGNAPAYYTTDSTLRYYKNSTLTISSTNGATITAVSSSPSKSFTVSNGQATLSFTATVKFTSITITYTAASGTTVNKDITGPSNMNKNVGDSSVDIASQIKVDGNTFSGCTVVSSNTDAVTVSGTTLSFVGAGNSTITISHANVVDGTTTYVYASATFTVTVTVVKSPLPSMASGDYGKITSLSDLTDGYYLLVCDSSSKAFAGSSSTLDQNTGTSVSISNDSIGSTSTIDNDALYIKSNGQTDGFSVAAKVKYADNGYKYIGRSLDSNGLDESDSALVNTITFDNDGHALITGAGGRRLCMYGGTTYRYYSTANTANLFLYKKGNSSATFNVTYDANGATNGSVPSDATDYATGATVTVLGNTGSLEKTGFSWNGWNTQADGEGTHYAAGGTFAISANTTLYAEWVKSLDAITAIGGTVTASISDAGSTDWDYSNLTVTGTLSGSTGQNVKAYVDLSSSTTIPSTAGSCTVSVTATKKSTVPGSATSLTNNSVSGEVEAAKLTYTVVFDYTKMLTTGVSYANENANKPKVSTATCAGHDDIDIEWESYQVQRPNGTALWMQFQGSGGGCIFNTTEFPGTITDVTLTEANNNTAVFTTYYGDTEHPTSGTTVGGKYFCSGITSGTGYLSSITVTFQVSDKPKVQLAASNMNLDVTSGVVMPTITGGGSPVSGCTLVSADDHIASITNNGGVQATGYGTVIISVSKEEDSGHIYLATTFTVTVGDSSKEASIMAFTAKASADVANRTADDGVVWSMEANQDENDFSDVYGINYGTSSKTMTSLVITTPADEERIIKNVVVEAMSASGTTTITVTVGSTAFTCSKTNSVTGNVSTFNFSGNATGAITITISGTASTKYGVKSIAVLYVGDEATSFASTFLSAISCTQAGTSKPTFNFKEGDTRWTWALLKAEYDKLSTTDQAKFAKNAEGVSATITECVARYDYIVGKYFVGGVDPVLISSDFMNRSPSPVGNGRIMLNVISTQTTNTSVIVIVTVGIAAIAIGGYFLLRKKKED